MDNYQKDLKKLIVELTHQFMHRAMRSNFHFAKKMNLSFSQMFILSKLHRHKEVTVGEISSILDISNSAASQLLDKLVQGDLIQRRENPHDRRRKSLELSENGKKVLKKSQKASGQWIENLSEQFTEEEAETISEGLTILLEKIKDTDPRKHCKENHHV